MEKELLKYAEIELLNELYRRCEQRIQSGTPLPKLEPQQYNIICSRCGKDATVPFKPKEGWNVYCPDCYTPKNQGGQENGPRPQGS